jgi:hypothetical protein
MSGGGLVASVALSLFQVSESCFLIAGDGGPVSVSGRNIGLVPRRRSAELYRWDWCPPTQGRGCALRPKSAPALNSALAAHAYMMMLAETLFRSINQDR